MDNNPEFSRCTQCGAVAVVMGGQNPKMYLVANGVCISCVADVVGRYSAEASYKRFTTDQDKKKIRSRKRKRTRATAGV